MLDLIRAIERKHCWAAGHWLFFTVVFGALPFWGLAAILWLNKAEFGWEKFVKDAQLVVYAAGLLSASVPAMQKDVKESRFKHPKWFLGVTMLVIALAALVFGASATTPDRFDLERLTKFSVSIVAAALLLGLLTELVREVREDPDLWTLRENEVRDLGDQVRRKLEGGNV